MNRIHSLLSSFGSGVHSKPTLSTCCVAHVSFHFLPMDDRSHSFQTECVCLIADDVRSELYPDCSCCGEKSLSVSGAAGSRREPDLHTQKNSNSQSERGVAEHRPDRCASRPTAERGAGQIQRWTPSSAHRSLLQRKLIQSENWLRA